MALTIKRGGNSAGLVADRRLYLTADCAKVVEEGSPEAASLFSTPGTVIPQDECERLDLESVDGRIRVRSAEEKEEELSPPAAAPPPAVRPGPGAAVEDEAPRLAAKKPR